MHTCRTLKSTKIVIIIEFRCRKSKTTTEETDRNSIATTTTLDGLTNVALDDDVHDGINTFDNFR
ncbi:Hypothetical predicted protein [Paramuricea clavata]|uniref:Uncharacterized protein n=1 Tax=Paramuricea clavata TaxID=317549 RepID=A0A7D9IRL6_PARCT|nr:Hypothetical predicted protein [Paramuricea clavata]